MLRILKKWKDLEVLKERALKRFINGAMGSGDLEKRWGIQKLRIFNHTQKVFQKCVTLLRAMEISDYQ